MTRLTEHVRHDVQWLSPAWSVRCATESLFLQISVSRLSGVSIMQLKGIESLPKPIVVFCEPHHAIAVSA